MGAAEESHQDLANIKIEMDIILRYYLFVVLRVSEYNVLTKVVERKLIKA